MRRMCVVLTLAFVLVNSMPLSIVNGVPEENVVSVFGVPEDLYSPNPQTSGNSVLSNLREAAEARRDELLYLFEEELPVEILRQLQNAIEHMGEARDLEISDPSAASKTYLETLRMFRVAWEMYLDYKPEAGEESLVEIIAKYTPEPQPQDIEVKIKDTKEKRITMFQEKILKKIEDSSDESDTYSVFDAVKSGFQRLNQMIRQGALTSAVDLLKVTMSQYEAGLDELDSKQSSKLDKTLTRLEDKLDREEKNESNGDGKPSLEFTEEETPNNSNDNNGNGRPEKEEKETGKSTVETEDKEKSNNGNGNNNPLAEDDTPETLDVEPEDEEVVPEEPTPEPEDEEKTNNGKGKPDDS